MKRTFKKISISVLGILFIITACRTSVNDINNQYTSTEQEITVYITNTGECWHRDDCTSLSYSKTAVLLNDINRSEYRPCKICRPPE